MAVLRDPVLILCMLCCASGKPVAYKGEPALAEHNGKSQEDLPRSHFMSKRFINQALTSGGFADNGLGKMRTKRGIGEDCEKLELCLLHARSRNSLFASFELYFVNRENARLWDHHAHSVADCERRFGDCA